MSFYNYGNISKAGTVKPGSCEILVAPLSYFSSIAVPTAHTAAGESKTISDDHAFNVGKHFFKFLGNVKPKNTGKGSTVGEQGSQTMKWEVSVPVGGLSAPLLEFIDGGLNEDFIVLVADGCACGVDTDGYLQLGCEKVPCKLTVDGDLGTIDGGFKGATLKFEAYGVPNVYTGDVSTY